MSIPYRNIGIIEHKTLRIKEFSRNFLAICAFLAFCSIIIDGNILAPFFMIYFMWFTLLFDDDLRKSEA